MQEVTFTVSQEQLLYALIGLVPVAYAVIGAVTAGALARTVKMTKPFDGEEGTLLTFAGAFWPVVLPLILTWVSVIKPAGKITSAMAKSQYN